MDDGSTDHTLAIARQFEGESVRVYTQANQGAAATRNTAFSLSKGDYIQWLDADDLLAVDKVEWQIAALQAFDSKRMLVSSPWAYFSYRSDRARFVPTSLWQDLSPVEWLLRKMGENLHMQTATWLTSRELAEAAGPWDTRHAGPFAPTQAGDLVYMEVCRTETQAATTFTAGTGQAGIAWAFVPGGADTTDGCAAQWGVYGSTNQLNPQMTMVAGSGYVATAIAFRAANAGSAPSGGIRVLAIQHEDVPTRTGGSVTFQVPSTGANLIVMAAQMGGVSPPSIPSVSDNAGNTWSSAGAINNCGIFSPSSQTYYIASPTVSDALKVTVNWSGTGDGTMMFYLITGADPSAPFKNRWFNCFQMLSVGPFQMVSGFNPNTTSGISIASIGVNFITVDRATTPAGNYFDSDTYGGENLDGPQPVDENNGW